MKRRIPISKKILILVFSISIFPLILTSTFNYFITKKTIFNLSSSYNNNLMQTLNENISLKFQDYLNLSNEFALDSTIINTLSNYEQLSLSEQNTSNRKIEKTVNSKFNRLKGIRSIHIYTTDGLCIYKSSSLFLNDTAMEENLNLIKSDKKPFFCQITYIDKNLYFVFSRKVQLLASGKDVGYITMLINPSSICDSLSAFQEESVPSIILMDSLGEYFSYDESVTLSQTTLEAIQQSPISSKITSFSEDKIFDIAFVSLSVIDWKLLLCIPYTFFYAPLKIITLQMFCILAFCIFFSILISYSIWKSIDRPLTEMIKKIEQVTSPDLESHFQNDNVDELSFLSDAYNKTLIKMQEMSLQIQKEQEEKRAAEIKMLQAQINPHFLFNTLDSLKFTAILSNALTVSEGLSSLSHILRNSIINGKSYIPISEEIENIKNYLTIQKIRYGESIQLHTKLSNGTEQCMIMKFLLQPIVENSIIHGGVENGGIEIFLTASLENGQITIILRDNGRGFDVTKHYDAQSDRFKSCKLSGIGLNNIRQRLALEYKENQCFSIQSSTGKGTIVTLSFPAEQKKGPNHV